MLIVWISSEVVFRDEIEAVLRKQDASHSTLKGRGFEARAREQRSH